MGYVYLVDIYRSEDKVRELDVEAVNGKPEDHELRKKFLEEDWSEIQTGPLTTQEEHELKEIVCQNLDAFALSPDNIGSFTAFYIPLEDEHNADPKDAYTKARSSDQLAQANIHQMARANDLSRCNLYGSAW